MGGLEMLRPIREGYTVKFNFPKEDKFKNYSIKCLYKYCKPKDKYSLSMWIMRNDIEEDYKIESQHIDTQYVPGTRETIEENICLIVEQALSTGYFDKYIDRYEYELSCFERGNELFETERLEKSNDNKK